MHDISDFNSDGLPSNKSLIKATLVAFFYRVYFTCHDNIAGRVWC